MRHYMLVSLMVGMGVGILVGYTGVAAWAYSS
jgi:hypothetical protein